MALVAIAAMVNLILDPFAMFRWVGIPGGPFPRSLDRTGPLPVEARRESRTLARCSLRLRQMQPGSLNELIQVLQLNEPDAFRYSFVYQNVQSSTGSTVIAL